MTLNRVLPGADLEPVAGDVLPPIGESVLIHLASQDEWVEHQVVGYYAWPDLGGNKNLHRVFVRVRDADGILNSRLLCEVRPVSVTHHEISQLKNTLNEQRKAS
jgi:hypothetical protein